VDRRIRHEKRRKIVDLVSRIVHQRRDGNNIVSRQLNRGNRGRQLGFIDKPVKVRLRQSRDRVIVYMQQMKSNAKKTARKRGWLPRQTRSLVDVGATFSYWFVVHRV
jgi:hypothetical protein